MSNLNKVQFMTDDDKYELTLPVKCSFSLERNMETDRYDIAVCNFDNIKNGNTITYTASGDTIEECFLTFAKGMFVRFSSFVDLN